MPQTPIVTYRAPTPPLEDSQLFSSQPESSQFADADEHFRPLTRLTSNGQARPIRFENFRIGPSLSNRIESGILFEFESNLEASQVPRFYVIVEVIIGLKIGSSVTSVNSVNFLNAEFNLSIYCRKTTYLVQNIH